MRYGHMVWIGIIIFFSSAAFSERLPLVQIVADFSRQAPGSLPEGWKLQNFPKIENHTSYRLVQESERTVLKAESLSSASALMSRMELNPAGLPILEWSWKIEEEVPGVWGEKAKDDFSARLFVIFENPKGPFSFLGSFFGKLAGGGFSGTALNYVWAAQTESGQMLASPYTSRVMMIAVEGGSGNLNRWVTERRNIVKDYRLAFGKEPGEIAGIAIMTDTDDTQTRAVSFYGDIRFLSDPALPNR